MSCSDIRSTKEFSIKETGFCGAYYKSSKPFAKDKALIILGGSSGGRISIMPVAAYFLKRGLDLIVLDYHGRKGLPKHLKNQPVEVVARAAKWLKSKGYNKIGVYGISMGTCLAVLAAACFPGLISCLVLVSPMYMVTQAERKNDSGVIDGSSFALFGKPFPYAK